jgi:RNA polymerase sigma factor (sigma-70 family)
MRTEDGSIIHECLNGKPQAFGVLVDKYREGIYAYAYAELRDFQDAQDVTQEVFLQAYRDLHSLRRRESFAFWLYRIAHRRCVQCCRDRSRRIDRDFIEDQDPGAVDGHSLDFYRESQLDDSVREALDSLPDAYREVLVLHYFGGMTIKDMARAMGVSPGAIGMRLSRARAQLREEMADMMDTAFEGQRLPVGFTFRIVEAVKRIKIHPMPRMAGLPWGLSAAVGIVVTVMSLNPHMSIPNDMPIPAGSLFPAESKALKAGEISVDVLNVSQIPALANMQGDGDGEEPELANPHNAAPMVAHGEGDTWTAKADMPTARWGLSTSVVDGIIYAIGGDSNRAGTAVEAYDPAADEWTSKAKMPTVRMELSTSVVNGKIYAIGGDWQPWPAPVAAVDEYDPVADKWTEKTDMPTPRGALAASVVDGVIYAIGGMDENFRMFSTVEAYDPVTDTWTEKAPMPTPRSWLSTSVVDGIIYAIGGTPEGGASTWDRTSAVEAYDPVTNTWTVKADMPDTRGAHSSSVVNGIIYVFGGTRTGSNLGITEVEAYDPVKDSWVEKANMPTGRHTLSSCALDGKIYAIGGVTRKGGINWASSTVEEYTPEGWKSSSVSPQGKLPATWGEVKQ